MKYKSKRKCFTIITNGVEKIIEIKRINEIKKILNLRISFSKSNGFHSFIILDTEIANCDEYDSRTINKTLKYMKPLKKYYEKKGFNFSLIELEDSINYYIKIDWKIK